MDTINLATVGDALVSSARTVEEAPKGPLPPGTRLLERYLDGPSVFGVVRDAKGRPVVAEVSIVEQQLQEQEHWLTRCRDGHYDRFLPGPGQYTVQVSVPGLPPLTRQITVGKERLRLDFIVEGVVSSGRCPPEPPG